MADNISTIGSDGGDDYSTIGAWESDTDNDLVTSTTREIGELRGEDHGGTLIDINGATTNSSYYRWLRSMDGHEFDHTDESGARIVSADVNYVIATHEGYTKLGGSEWLSTGSIGAKGTHATGNMQGFVATSASSNVEFHQLVAYEFNCSGVALDKGRLKPYYVEVTEDLTCYNCLCFTPVSEDEAAYGWHRGICYNCAALKVKAKDFLMSSYGFHTCVCYNCYSGGHSAGGGGTAYNFTDTCTGDYNASPGTDSPGDNSTDNVAVADCNFVDTGGAEDFHIQAGSDLIDIGNDGYGNIWDLDGLVSTRDDIGPYELPVAIVNLGPLVNRASRRGAVVGGALT